MLIGGLQKSSTIDYPSKLSCVIFTIGCNLDCFYCHNRQLIENAPLIDEDEVLYFLKKRRHLLDGVVISGGEPTLQKDLIDFIKKVKELGYSIKLDTNGQNLKVVQNLIEEKLIDYLALDFKCLPKDQKFVLGSNNYFANILQTFHYLNRINFPYELRTTLYPTMTLDELKSLLNSVNNVKLWRLNFYHIPQVIKKGYENVVNANHLNKFTIEKHIDELKQLQPNLIY
ncbi:MAG: anaerobic ribonucleoside-triphosphate reductase activating protein [Bacilli bacterium]|nr:anaerobic ribonucleoside-triphosphate reductase activating protein [Bacilli bacterium]